MLHSLCLYSTITARTQRGLGGEGVVAQLSEPSPTALAFASLGMAHFNLEPGCIPSLRECLLRLNNLHRSHNEVVSQELIVISTFFGASSTSRGRSLFFFFEPQQL